MVCPDIILVTDHQLLTGIFSDRNFSKIHNPCLFKLKEKLLRYFFTVYPCLGKWHMGSDTISRNLVTIVEASIGLFSIHLFFQDINDLDKIDTMVESEALQ